MRQGPTKHFTTAQTDRQDRQRGQTPSRSPEQKSLPERRLHERLACVVRVDNRASVAHVAVTPAVWKAIGLWIVVFAVLVAAADVSGCAALSSQCLPTVRIHSRRGFFIKSFEFVRTDFPNLRLKIGKNYFADLICWFYKLNSFIWGSAQIEFRVI